MQELFRTTGAQGGKARAANMTKKQRSAAARKAAKARWDKVRAENNKSKKKPH
jgi:hypothetical protein